MRIYLVNQVTAGAEEIAEMTTILATTNHENAIAKFKEIRYRHYNENKDEIKAQIRNNKACTHEYYEDSYVWIPEDGYCEFKLEIVAKELES